VIKALRDDRHAPGQELDVDVELGLLARAEHLRVLFKHSLIVLLANVAGGVTLFVGLGSVVPTQELVGWLAVLVLLNLTRWVTGHRLARKPIEVAQLRRLETLFVSGTLASGLLWGTAALLFYVPGQPGYGIFLALILVAMTAASTVLLSFHRFAFLVFCTPVIIPLAWRLGLDQGAPQTAVLLVIPLYYSLLLVLSRQIYRFSHEAIVTSLLRQREALIDQLTAIPNRRAFEEFLDREWIRGIRSGRPLALILSDIDDFKIYNDSYGHAVGDAILRSVAGIFLQAARRRTDLAARIGGDEFAIIAPETDRSGIAYLVRTIEESRTRLAEGTFEDWSFPTLSFGYCTVTPSDSGSVFELFEAADAALYEAKLAGRNRAAQCTKGEALHAE
jgi:diguanylate cyclase (GGDEF)-like protein